MKKIIIFVVSCFIGCLNVSAASNDSQVEYQYIDNIYSNREIGQNFYTGPQGIVYVNGELAYCLDASLTLNESIYSSSTDFSIHNIDEEMLNYLELVNYFGYGYENRTDSKYYLATQEIIWEYLSGGEIYWTNGKGGEVINIDTYKNEILNSIEKYLLTPNIPSYNETYQHEDIILEDSNNVLKYYTPNLFYATIEGNKLILNADKKGTIKINLTKNPLSSKASYIYFCNNSQTLATFGYSNTKEESITITYKVKTLSRVTLVKKDLFNKKVIKNKKTKIKIYDVTKNKYITQNGSDILTIDETGSLELESSLEEGSYRVEELVAPLGYKKLDSAYTFRVSEYDGSTKTVPIYNQPWIYNIYISKKVEKYSGIEKTANGAKGIYSLEDANDVIYGLYAAENIYTADGEILYEKDVLISQITIENGVGTYSEIPYGNYYLKELECPAQYELNPTIIELSLTGDDSTVDLNFVNYLKKGNITIRKVYNEIGLANAEFQIYSENYLNSVSVNSNDLGYIIIENMPYDTYHLTETKSPDGYKIDSEEKTLLLNTTNIVYNFENEKEKIEEVTPEDSKEPANPEKSEDIEIPIVPDESIESEEPQIPVTPEKPEVPDEPEIPIVPALPEISDDAEVPVVPSIPIKPEEPETPIVNEPEISVVPDKNQTITPESPNDSDEKNSNNEEAPSVELTESVEDIVENPGTYVGSYNYYILNIVLFICILFGIKK